MVARLGLLEHPMLADTLEDRIPSTILYWPAASTTKDSLYERATHLSLHRKPCSLRVCGNSPHLTSVTKGAGTKSLRAVLMSASSDFDKMHDRIRDINPYWTFIFQLCVELVQVSMQKLELKYLCRSWVRYTFEKLNDD